MEKEKSDIGRSMRLGKKGIHLSPETECGGDRGPSFKGHNWGLCKICGKDHGLNPAVGKKRPNLSLKNKTPEAREITRLRSLGNTYGKANKGRIVSAESRLKQSISMTGKRTPKIKRDGYYGNHNWISRREPNKSEQLIIGWIEESELPFKFTGNKIDAVLGISPDWTHISKPYYIEFDCAFWHKDVESDLFRNQIYKNNECKLLILNDKDLKNKEDTLMKIKVFENE
jgi:hypothetical protein